MRVYAYSKILRGIPKEEIATVANWKWAHLPEALHSVPGAKAITNILHELPQSAAIGAGIGLLLAAPFLPGMLGDRKTADERRRIYSGEQLVPVRQGRFWEMGPTPGRAAGSSTSVPTGLQPKRTRRRRVPFWFREEVRAQPDPAPGQVPARSLLAGEEALSGPAVSGHVPGLLRCAPRRPIACRHDRQVLPR